MPGCHVCLGSGLGYGRENLLGRSRQALPYLWSWEARVSRFSLEALEGKVGGCLGPSPQAEATSLASFLRLKESDPSEVTTWSPADLDSGGPPSKAEPAPVSFGTSPLPTPSCSSTYRGSHESRRASGARVPLWKRPGALRQDEHSFPTVFPLGSPSPGYPRMEGMSWEAEGRIQAGLGL